jgi:phage baseplate assembly protein V
VSVFDEPRSESADRRYFGLMIGLVTDVQDPEKEGRIKVNYPWFNETMESDWMPVMQFFAGPSHGSFFIPEVGTAVVVAALHGNLDEPVVIGCIYNGQDKPTADHVRKREIASVNGHKLTMIDSNGDTAGGVILQDAAGSKIVISSTGHVTIKAMGALSLQAPHIRLNGRVVSNNKNPI